jgi:hypothetical protein
MADIDHNTDSVEPTDSKPIKRVTGGSQYVPTGMPAGRPEVWTQELEDTVLDLLSEKSLVGTCKQVGITPRTVYKWIESKEGFLAKYSRACEERASYCADAILEASYDLLNPDGVQDANRSRVGIDGLKWSAARLFPKKYSDKHLLEVSSTVNHTNLSDDDLSRRLLELRTAHEIASKT